MNNGERSSWDKMDWETQVIQRIENVLTNHNLKIQLGGSTGDMSEGICRTTFIDTAYLLKSYGMKFIRKKKVFQM